MATAAEVMQGLDDLADFYGRSQLTEKQGVQWFKKLKWLDKRDFDVAIEEITSREKFFPTPSKILEYADSAKTRRTHNEKQMDKVEAKNFFNPSSHRSPVAKECVQFIDEVYRLRGQAKWEFEMSWAKAMMKKYSSNAETARGFRDMMLSAKRKLDEYYSQQNEKEVVNG